MEKQVLLALEAPVEKMAIEQSKGKGKGGRPIKSTPGKEFMGMYDLTRADDSLVKLRQEAKEKGLSSSGTKETLIDRLKEYDFKKMEEEEARPKGQKQITSFFMPQLQEKQEPLITELQDEEESQQVVGEIIGEIVENALDVPIQNLAAAPEPEPEPEPEQEQEPEPEPEPEPDNRMKFKNETQIQKLNSSQAIKELEKYGETAKSGSKAKKILSRKFRQGKLSGKGLDGAGFGLGARGLGAILHTINKIPKYPKDTPVKGGILGFIKNLATKAINHIAKDPIGAIKSAVNIGKQAYEHGTKAKEMYDKYFKKDKDKGGMLAGFTEPKKKLLVHHMYKLHLFNKSMES
jgi:hypothetical protein